MSKTIDLTKGKKAIVDNEDYEFLSQWRWIYHHTGYAMRSCAGGGKDYNIPMHKVLQPSPPGLITDHINTNTLDNRKHNLRIATIGQNSIKFKIIKSKTTSKYKGVSGRSGGWMARIKYTDEDGSRHAKYLGWFKEEKDAAKAYNDAAIQYHGRYSKLNPLD